MEGKGHKDIHLLKLIFDMQVVQPLSEIKSLRELAIREGFEGLQHGTGIVVVGVDARCTHSGLNITLLTLIIVHGFMSARLPLVAVAVSTLMLV